MEEMVVFKINDDDDDDDELILIGKFSVCKDKVNKFFRFCHSYYYYYIFLHAFKRVSKHDQQTMNSTYATLIYNHITNKREKF